MSFMSLAVGMGASGIGASMLAGGMMGAATGAVGNLVRGKGLFDNFGQNVLMGGATAGIASGIGSALGGETQAAIDAAKAVPAAEGSNAANMVLRNAATNTDTAIKEALETARNADFTGNFRGYIGDDAYRASLTQNPIDNRLSYSARPFDFASNPYSQAGTGYMQGQGLTGSQIAQSAGDYAANNAVVPPAGMQAPGMQTKIGNYLVQNPSKVAGVASGLLSLQPNKFTPPPVKPTSYYKTSYNPPQYNPVTKTYSDPSYGPGTRSTTYVAQGGAVGYAEGGPAYYPMSGDSANTGGLGGRGDKPQNPSDIYTDDSAEIPDVRKLSNAQLDLVVTDADNSLLQGRAIDEEYRRAATRRTPKSTYTKHAAYGGLMGTYAAGGRLLQGPGDGMSDSIPAVINGPKPQRAALAQGEFVIPADVVSHLGNGSTDAGARRLYAMMDKIRHARTGNKKQGRQINPNKFMPA